MVPISKIEASIGVLSSLKSARSWESMGIGTNDADGLEDAFNEALDPSAVFTEQFRERLVRVEHNYRDILINRGGLETLEDLLTQLRQDIR